MTHTGQVSGLSNMTKTLGGAVASSVFALALACVQEVASPHASLTGYLMVWGLCALGALAAAGVLAASSRRRVD